MIYVEKRTMIKTQIVSQTLITNEARWFLEEKLLGLLLHLLDERLQLRSLVRRDRTGNHRAGDSTGATWKYLIELLN